MEQHLVDSSRNFKLEFLFHTANLIDIYHTDQRFVQFFYILRIHFYPHLITGKYPE